jgi:hypothetical protein
MKIHKTQLVEKIKQYHFELNHLLVLLAILILSQLLVSLVHKIALQNFLVKTQEWYQRDFAERLANLSTTSLELLLESSLLHQNLDEADAQKIVQAFNIILSQQLLQHHVQEVSILLARNDEIIAIDNGHVLFSYLIENQQNIPPPDASHTRAIEMYRKIKDQIIESEQIYSILEGRQTFHIFVPFVPKGEYVGVVYMKNTPAFDFITSGIISSYNETSLIFTAFILFGLLAMFYISSHTVRKRNEAQQLLYQEREMQLKEHIHLQKEVLFAKRIYHTHHKAEKVMGFIKEDLHALSGNNIDEIKYRVTKYANFISRVIYDMKWFDPPIQAIRNPIFKTNLNELIQFIVRNIFLRVSTNQGSYQFDLELDEHLPVVPINEFVVWEILEPLIQNSIEHAGDEQILVRIKTQYFPELHRSTIIVSDNGDGIRPDLLEPNELGTQRLFLENTSTKAESQNSGYGCYIAHEIASQRCGWKLNAENLNCGGCQFIITIPHQPIRKVEYDNG